MALRAVTADDADRLLEWRNDELAVRFSGSGRPVTPDEHARWFEGRRRDRAARFWVAVSDGSAVGQVRIDAIDGVGVIAIVVDPRHRGRGFGAAILRAAILAAAGDPGLTRLRALCHRDNRASLRLFEAAGFRRLAVAEDGLVALEL